MDLRTLIVNWLADKHPDVIVEEAIIMLRIDSQHMIKTYEGDVWYVCRIEEDRLHLLSPASRQFGSYLLASTPTFFEQLDAVIAFYRAYAP